MGSGRSQRVFATVKSFSQRGKLLSKAELQTLAESRDLDELITRIKNTKYADSVAKVVKPYTAATIESGAYLDAFAAAPHLEITSQACPKFVEFVERGETSGSAVTDAAQRYLEPLKSKGVDTLVLGCTHYPLLTGVISYVMGENVTLVSSAEETAKDLYRVLVEKNLLRSETTPPHYSFVSSGDPQKFAALARRFLGPEVLTVKRSDEEWQ